MCIRDRYQEGAEEQVLSDISFHIAPGQTVGIIGPTGSAKSTLVQLIPRLYDATRGVVRVDGRPVQEYPLRLSLIHILCIQRVGLRERKEKPRPGSYGLIPGADCFRHPNQFFPL